MRFLKLAILILGILTFTSLSFSQKSDCPAIEEQAAKHLQANQYNELVDFLNKQEKDKDSSICVEFYKARARFEQLKYLEEKQLWDEYFANGNIYREELEKSAAKVIGEAQANDPLRLRTRLILWQYHHGQQDVFVPEAMDNLITDANAYAKEVKEPQLLKDAADILSSNGEKTKARQIYKLYVDQMAKQNMSEADLKKTAAAFYRDGNLELSESVFNIYLEKASKNLVPEKLVGELFEIASMFVYKSQGLYDMGYAEEIYAKIEALNIKDSFDEETLYLRAFNLEKLRDYREAKNNYLKLMQAYPATKYLDEVNFKIGLINAYALSDLPEAKKVFETLCAKDQSSPHTLASCYQLGLISQWEANNVKAKEYYEALIKNAESKYPSIISPARDRLKEIEENKSIEYNLKTFLDLSLQKEPPYPLSEMDKAELKFSSFVLSKDQKGRVSVAVNMPQSGCNQVDLQYLWSGDLGGAVTSALDSEFECAYPDSGTKIINLVVISPAGPIDRSFTLVDVY